jgi:magnesium chelatase subunit I
MAEQRDLPRTVGELRASGWRSRPVKEELRSNVLAAIREGRPALSGLVGYDDTVLPALEHALIAGHDVILLGERGQGKTRILRSLVELLDEWMPALAGTELRDDPLAPQSAAAIELLAEAGEEAPVEWVHRSDRYAEKLATPDTSIADLIGDIDPVKVAEGRYLSDVGALHFGLLPRANRGILAINELPDLAERIQVGLLNVLEERDVQIRGHQVRIPLDVVLVASANPEDYTNRGRIITPLKDRFGAEIRTHYPEDWETEAAVVLQEATVPSLEGLAVSVPAYMLEIVAELTMLARRSPRVSQRSGVSVRLSIANYETLVATAARRALRLGEPEAVPRVSDLPALRASTEGRLEPEGLDDVGGGDLAGELLSAAVLSVFRRRVPTSPLGAVVEAFDQGLVARAGPGVPSKELAALLSGNRALAEATDPLAEGGAEAELASATELVLEGLFLTKKLSKRLLDGADQVGYGRRS